jgi:hypothetical protein
MMKFSGGDRLLANHLGSFQGESVAMKNTNLPLLKFGCDNRDCSFECYVNQNNNQLTHYNPNMSALLDWPCPDCKEGSLRYGSTNAHFEFSLTKAEKLAQERSQ